MGYTLEELEWDNVWWESTGNTEAKRVLYIGDSISCALRRLATEASGMRILFDGYGSSKALDNPYLIPAIQMFGRQEGRRELVLVNNGLHGFHLDDETEYPAGYEKLIGFLKEEYAGTPLAVVLTTSAGGGNNDRGGRHVHQSRCRRLHRARVRPARPFVQQHQNPEAPVHRLRRHARVAGRTPLRRIPPGLALRPGVSPGLHQALMAVISTLV